MNLSTPGRSELVVATSSQPLGDLAVRSGAEVAGLMEVLYLRLVVIALGGLQFVCALAVIIAFVRTNDANFARTTALAALLALLAALALRAREHVYLAMRRRPLLSLGAPVLALTALVIDGVSHSPMSYVAAVSVALTAFVSGRRWALAAATLVSVGAVTAAMLRTGLGALNSVGQGTSGYFVWALVCSGLAESFALLTTRLPQTTSPPAEAVAPKRVPNLAGEPPVPKPEPATSAPAPGNPSAALSGAGRLTARQLQVVALLADGLRADQIAQRLGITTSTVYRHVERANERAGVRSRSELVALAIRDGIVPRP